MTTLKSKTALANASQVGQDTACLTIATASQLVAGWTDLTDSRRRDLLSALSSLARMTSLPPDAVVLTPASLRQHLPSRSGMAYGIKSGTMKTVMSAIRFVLRRLGMIDAEGAPFSEAWLAAIQRVETSIHERAADGFRQLARFCSARQIAPETVDAGTLLSFERHLSERTLTPNPRQVVRNLRGRWNSACRRIPNWAGLVIERQKDPHDYTLPSTAFSPAFQAALDAFRASMCASIRSATRTDDTPLPNKPVRAITATLRQSHARWAASAAVAAGVPIEEIASLIDLVRPPSRPEAILEFLWRRAGEKPSAAGMHVGEVLRIIAVHYAKLPPEDVAFIKKCAGKVALRYDGMTLKNRRLMQQLRDPERQAILLRLPSVLMEAAEKMRGTSPAEAAALAMRAVAIHLLLRFALRLENLTGMRLDRHLQRAGLRRTRITSIAIPFNEMKGKDDVLMPVSEQTAEVLENWITNFRPHVARPGCMYLFPGRGRGAESERITHQGMRDAVKSTLEHHLGIQMSPHQFRHFAAHMYLDEHEGHYEPVRQLLCHASLATTTRSYSGIESAASFRRYDAMVEKRLGELAKPTPAGTGRNARAKPTRGKR